MATRNIREFDVEISELNVPLHQTIIGAFRNLTGNTLLADDTVGPVFDFDFYHDPECKEKFESDDSNWMRSVHIIVSGRGMPRDIIYERSLWEYNNVEPVFKRYRNPFRRYEKSLDRTLDKKPLGGYFGNPDFSISHGDDIYIRITSPLYIRQDTSRIKLRFIELAGHVGPKEIHIDSISDDNHQIDLESRIERLADERLKTDPELVMRSVYPLLVKAGADTEEIRNITADLMSKKYSRRVAAMVHTFDRLIENLNLSPEESEHLKEHLYNLIDNGQPFSMPHVYKGNKKAPFIPFPDDDDT